MITLALVIAATVVAFIVSLILDPVTTRAQLAMFFGSKNILEDAEGIKWYITNRMEGGMLLYQKDKHISQTYSWEHLQARFPGHEAEFLSKKVEWEAKQELRQ